MISNVAIKGINSTGYIDSINIRVELTGNLQNSIPLYFRIIQSGPAVDGKGKLWLNEKNLVFSASQVYRVTIVPQYPGFAINVNKSFVLIA